MTAPILTGLLPHDWEKVNSIQGWLNYSAADFTCRIIRSALFQNCPGALAEIGVFKGKYLALLAHAALGQSRQLIGVDGFLAGPNKPLEDRWVDSVKSHIQANVELLDNTCLDRLDLYRANTNDLSPTSFRNLIDCNIAFLSIDAGHEAEDVYNDLRISLDLLSPLGIIALDDVFNAVVPGVAQGFCGFMGTSMGREFAPFATCGNKLFICRKESHDAYFSLASSLLESRDSDYLEKSKAHVQRNAAIGYTPKMFGSFIVPFLH